MITASIVSYQHRAGEIMKLLDCILDSPVDTLYLIDNSLNDSLRKLEELSDRIRYIHSANLGYGAGHNIAIKEAIERNTQYHIIINPDVYFESVTIGKLRDYMESNSDIGLLMPKILYPNGNIQYLCKLLPTPMDLLGRRFIPWKKYIKKRNYKYELHGFDYNTIKQVPSLSGCFMFIRMSVLQEIGGFDERFFMYAEDLDLCRRIGEVAKTVYYPEVEVFHEYAKGSYKNSKLLRYHIYSVIKYFNKWGWFFDQKRRRINRQALAELSLVKALDGKV